MSTREEFASLIGKWSFKYLNWTYLYEADVFLQFRVLIRILEPICVPNQSRDSFILIKLNTLSTREEFASLKGKWSFKYLNWTYLYEADVFLQFRVLIRNLEPICVPNPRSLFRDSVYFNKIEADFVHSFESLQRFIYFKKSLLASRGKGVYSILIGHKIMKQMFFFNFGFWFGF